LRRWIAGLFLVLALFYVGASIQDRCEDSCPDSVPVCHLLCSDGCATAPVPATPMAPPSDPLPRPRYEVARAGNLSTLEIEPEIDPPRA
jgi:hypothetical protein